MDSTDPHHVSPSAGGTPARRVLVLGAAGMLGGAVLHALTDPERPDTGSAPAVTVLTRRPVPPAALPDGVVRRVGDLTDPRAVRAAVAGQDAVFFVSPHEYAEERIARTTT